MARRHGGTITVYTDVDVDVWEVLSELSDDDILEEVKSRKLEAKISKSHEFLIDQEKDLLDEVFDHLRRGNNAEAILTLERITRPKFSSVALCVAELEKLRAKS